MNRLRLCVRPLSFFAFITAMLAALLAGHCVGGEPIGAAVAVSSSVAEPRAGKLFRELYQGTDSDIAKTELWTRLKSGELNDNERRLVLNHAFNLVTQDSVELVYILFERKAAPEFVYIQPRRFDVVKNGVVIQQSTVDSTGNGVEVHPESSGRGPFAWGVPLNEIGDLQDYEFRVYYEVTYAPSMKWLEGFESYLQFPPPAMQAFDLAAGLAVAETRDDQSPASCRASVRCCRPRRCDRRRGLLQRMVRCLRR